MQNKPRNYNNPYENLRAAAWRAFYAGKMSRQEVDQTIDIAYSRARYGYKIFWDRYVVETHGREAMQEVLIRFKQECEDSYWRGRDYYDQAVKTGCWGRWNVGIGKYV